MSLDEISEMKDKLEDCHNLRCEFIQDYCGGKADRGHIGAMEKMRGKLKKCSQFEQVIKTEAEASPKPRRMRVGAPEFVPAF